MPRLAVQISRRLCLYLLGIGIIVIASSFASWTLYEKVTLSRHLGSGLLPMKMSYYKNHVDEFDMIFLGDSKSFCGMHPDQIDAEMGTNSFNISHWANWLPTQYALLGDLIDDIPEETHVVWSIGHINFIKGSIQPVYPIGLETVFYLKGMDYSLEEMLRAFISFEPSFALLGRREQGKSVV